MCIDDNPRARRRRRTWVLANIALFLSSAVMAQDTTTPTPRARSGSFDPAIESLAGKLERDYIIPATGARYAAMLRANLARGTYADFADAAQLAGRLTADLRAVAPDGHLRVATGADVMRRVRVDRSAPPDAAGPRPAPPEPRPGATLQLRPAGPPIEDPKWIADGVAYIRLNEMPGTPETVAAVDQFMRDHATARAIIIDARTLRGGGMAEMNVMFPYLYSRETTLVAMEVSQRIDDERRLPLDAGAPMRAVTGPPGVVRREHFVVPHPDEHRLFDAQVFFLTSNRTASAGEHLALALKRTHRATLVGGRTAGGNHFGGFEDLGQGLSAFIPIGRTFDPDTGADWEGIGIVPDVDVAPDAALDEALRRLSVSDKATASGARVSQSARSARSMPR
jgi:hypothetical protein